MDKMAYKSFFWSFGTTSFRMKNFNKNIEEQLKLLKEFWEIPENENEQWEANNNLQERYYDFLIERNFIKGEARNKSKDARQKTSGLVDIGLLDDGRKLTEAGIALYEISERRDFSRDGMFNIPKDSFIYFKQLIKTSNIIDGKIVRPFIVLLYALNQLEYLSFEEYTYLLPLCIDEDTTETIIEGIRDIRNGEKCIDDIIIDRIMSIDSYEKGFREFVVSDVNEEIISNIVANRKSNTESIKYFPIYNYLHKVFVERDKTCLVELYRSIDSLSNSKTKHFWKKSFFKENVTKYRIERRAEDYFNPSCFVEGENEADFKKKFFELLHLFKAKSTLSDYFDLNRRYVRTTDIIRFVDGQVKLDVIPESFFSIAIDGLYEEAFSKSEYLCDNCGLREISECLAIDEAAIIEKINEKFGIEASNIADVITFVDDERYNRFNELINTKFTDDALISLLDSFETRNDEEIYAQITNDATIPTMFEYVLGIVWYKLSDRRGRILDYMKLSLDADLLPKTHAGGGTADIVYEYETTERYPTHTMLLEATLSDAANQRRMEMEPVSRHLGDYLLENRGREAYCVFVTNNLFPNVISDFRVRKNSYYYDSVGENYIEGMKIIPFATAELKKTIQDHKNYDELYEIFETAFNMELQPMQWYGELSNMV